MCIYSVLAKALGQVRVRERERESNGERVARSAYLFPQEHVARVSVRRQLSLFLFSVVLVL